MQFLAVLGVESAPEDGVILTFSYPARLKEGFTERVEFAVIIDDIGLIVHALPGVLVGKVQ